MQYLLCWFFLGLILYQRVSGQKVTKHIFEFGKDDFKSFKLMQFDGLMENWVNGQDISVQVTQCQYVSYVRVVIDNKDSKPTVTSTLKDVSILYGDSQISKSKFSIVFKGKQTCKERYQNHKEHEVPGDHKEHEVPEDHKEHEVPEDHKEHKIYEDQMNPEIHEEYQDKPDHPGNHDRQNHHEFQKVSGQPAEYVFEFGENDPSSFEIMNTGGMLENWEKGIDVSVRVPDCFKVNYVRVTIRSLYTKPTVTATSTLEDVSILYEESQRSESTYSVIFKATMNCKKLSNPVIVSVIG